MQTLKPIHAKRGAIANYKRKLEDIIKEMSDSYLYWLTAAYHKNPPLGMVKRSLPSNTAQQELDKLHEQWRHRFELIALFLALFHVNRTKNITERVLKRLFSDAGIKNVFTDTRIMRDSINAIVSENVGLIKSIPEQYHTKIEGIVMRGYANGDDLDTIRQEIQSAYPITKRRASTIAGDQISKINMLVQNIRYIEAGITEAKWVHSHLGVPRPDHLAADGRIYNIADGCLIGGKYIQPGELINCKCVSRAIINS